VKLVARRTVLAVVGAVVALAVLAAPARSQSATWTALSWGTTFSQPFSVSEAQGLALGGKLYSFGGFDSRKACCTPTARAYRMDPASGWTALAAMPAENGTGFGGVTHAGLATDGTYIYWAGGYTSDAAGTGQIFGTREVWRYDPVANAYQRMPDLPIARAAGQLAYLGGRLHYFGGTNLARTADVGEHWALDLSNTSAGWVARAALPNPRHHMGAAVLDGKIYAIGGQHAHDAQLTTQDDVHSYDPLTDAWTQRADLPKAVSHISSATFAMDGRILVLGGEVAHDVVIADTYAYSPQTDRWSALTPLPSARRSGVAGPIGGIVYYAGGETSSTYKGVPATSSEWPKRFNFQPAAAPVPAGYAVDSGRGYDAARGSGWIREDSIDATHVALDISPNTRDRNLVSDQRLDTLVHMQFPAGTANDTAVRTPAAWELAVPNGSYTVTLSVGDAAATDSTHRINVEGAVAISAFQPTSSVRFASATKTVTVADGRLTIDARGGTNTKLDYIEVAPASPTADTTPPAAPSSLTATAGDGQIALKWAASSSSDVAGYRVYRSTTTPVARDNAISGASLVTGTSFTDATAQNGTTYNYVVVAVDSSANVSDPSPTATATAQGTAPPPVNLKINFQPASAAVPSGYTADGGLGYSATRDFGWVREDSLSTSTHVALDVSPNARDRNLVSDQRLDTLIHMQYPATASSSTAVRTPAAWEAAVPAGTYSVTVGVGDAEAVFDSTHRIRVEGVTAIAGFTPTSSNRFAQATQSVVVSDGRLTIDAIGGTNTKIDFVTVTGG
jgi:N-acetylneuraminic acid mutarotase